MRRALTARFREKAATGAGANTAAPGGPDQGREVLRVKSLTGIGS